MLKFLFSYLAFLFFLAAPAQGLDKISPSQKARQDSIIEKYLKQGAWKHHYFTKEWQANIDEGLKLDSTIGYLWQQKAMPFFKQRKYETGLQYLDKAVQYDKAWLDYRAFIKCIFVKTYKDALIDFEACKKMKGNAVVMDHSYDFYMALCYLQLNDVQKAFSILHPYLEKTKKEKGDGWLHHLDLFYLGIIYYELDDYDNAIAAFDKALLKYSNFSDAKYFKGKCIALKGDMEKGHALIKEAKADFDKGYTINEDNSIYEPYPYQVNWKMVRL